MSERARAMLVTKWTQQRDGGYTADVSTRVELREADSFSVQVANVEPERLAAKGAAVTLVAFDGAPATLDAVRALGDVLVLGAETYDAETGVVVSSDWDEALDSTAQREGKDGLDAVVGKDAGAVFERAVTDIFREGVSRKQVLDDVTDAIATLDAAVVKAKDARP